MRTLVCSCVVSEPNVSVNGWVLCPKCAEPLAKPGKEAPTAPAVLKVSRPLKVKDLKALIAAIDEKYNDEDVWYIDFNGYAEPEVHVDSDYGLSIFVTVTWVKGVRIVWFSDRPAGRVPPTLGDGTIGQPRPENEPAPGIC